MKLNMKKLNMKKLMKIMCIVLLLLVIFVPMSDVYGEINKDTDLASNASQDLKNFFGFLMSTAMGPLGAAIATLINVVILAVFALLAFVFSPISNGFMFPFPDQIIFNKIPFFDPNFINPGLGGSTAEAVFKTTPVVLLQDLIQNLYYTGFIIAGAVFVIAAMIIGIKLAVSTIASDKAHYKQALMTWLVGLFLLFTTHFIMLGIFTVNERIVYEVSRATEEVPFSIDVARAIPLFGSSVGKAISGIINSVAGFFGAADSVTDFHVDGYGGLLLRFALYAVGGDMVASIICGIVLGQTCAIIIMYLKRLFYSIILGMIAPLIIAADIMKKTI